MEQIYKVIDRRIVLSVIVIIVVFIILKILKSIVNSRVNKKSKNITKRDRIKETYIRLISNIFKYVTLFSGLIIILQIFGINVTSIAAGIGIVSIVAGLALQDALKDVIAGFNIILDNYFSVGDVVKINNITGKVIFIGIKATKLKDIYTQDVYVISNRNIVEALEISQQFDIDIPLRYEEKIEKVEKLLDYIIEKNKKNSKVIDMKYIGIDEFGNSAIKYKLRVWCMPEEKPQLKRDIQRQIKITLDENNIVIPFNQLDVYIKNK